MELLIINFELAGITETGYRNVCDQIAPAFAAVPGLASKVWLADAANGVYGGVPPPEFSRIPGTMTLMDRRSAHSVVIGGTQNSPRSYKCSTSRAHGFASCTASRASANRRRSGGSAMSAKNATCACSPSIADPSSRRPRDSSTLWARPSTPPCLLPASTMLGKLAMDCDTAPGTSIDQLPEYARIVGLAWLGNAERAEDIGREALARVQGHGDYDEMLWSTFAAQTRLGREVDAEVIALAGSARHLAEKLRIPQPRRGRQSVMLRSPSRPARALRHSTKSPRLKQRLSTIRGSRQSSARVERKFSCSSTTWNQRSSRRWRVRRCSTAAAGSSRHGRVSFRGARCSSNSLAMRHYGHNLGRRKCLSRCLVPASKVQLDAAAAHLTATLGPGRFTELAARGSELDVPQLLALLRAVIDPDA